MSAATPRPGRLGHSPVVLHDGQWRLVSGPGSIVVTDPTFTSLLGEFAQAMAAADETVADLRDRRSEPPASKAGGQR
ncbi:hypothetical protein ACFCXR_26000 [Streptomyces noursei]|uniref:hypothetical protein n=1 Tax=Streptomyces TaxID=1883 RepID=UPI0035E0CE9F